MTDPVIFTDCPACDERTRHSREQRGKADPPHVETDLICSECGDMRTRTQQLHTDE